MVADFDGLLPTIDKPYFLHTQGKVGVALELAVVHLRRPTQYFDREPVLCDIVPIEPERKPRRVDKNVGLELRLGANDDCSGSDHVRVTGGHYRVAESILQSIGDDLMRRAWGRRHEQH